MENTLYVGISRLNALSRQMDVVANNIANVSTPAFKTERLLFVEYLQKHGFSDEVAFVNDMGTHRDFSAGAAQKTDNDFDIMIEGDGYFPVTTPAGERYTRLGRFRLGVDNTLVTAQGYQVLDDARRVIRLPDNASDITITEGGNIVADGATVARLGISYFNNQHNLRKTADGYYKSEGVLPEVRIDEEKTALLQGYFEGSNVNGVQEITNMISIQRAFEMTSNLIEKEDERLKRMMRAMGPNQG